MPSGRVDGRDGDNGEDGWTDGRRVRSGLSAAGLEASALSAGSVLGKAELGNDLAPVDSRFVPPVSQPALRCCWGLLVGHERKCAFVWLLM